MATFNVTNDSQWNTAYASANTGDVIYMRAGTYSAKTVAKQITVIGYQSTQGDIVATNGSTFDIGDSPSAATMPLIFSSGSTGTGLSITASNVTVRNIQIQNFSTGLNATSVNNITLDNIIAINQGVQNATGYNGFGIHIIFATNSTIKNCFAQNANAEIFKIYGGSNNLVQYTTAYCNNFTNPSDYYMLLTTTNDNIIEHSNAVRTPGLSHNGHGFVMKWDAQNNIVRDSYVTGTTLEVNFADVTNNLFENIRMEGDGNYETCFSIQNGANNNTFRNVYLTNADSAFRFTDSDDGFTPNPDTDEISLGYNNRFENIIIDGADELIIALPGLTIGGDPNAEINNNVWDGCTFNNVGKVGTFYARNNGNQFINCAFKDVTNAATTGGTSPYVNNGVNLIFTNSRFENSNVPSGTNITSGTIGFTNTGTGVERFQLTSGSAARNAGADTTNPTDYWGATRDSSPDQGAIQFGSTPGGSGNATPVVTLTGSPTINLNVGQTYTEQGASWTDAEDGSGTISSPTTGSVNTSVADTYTLTYTHTDSGGLSSTVTRTVNVIQGQYPTPTGQVMFNDAQWNIIVDRLNGNISTPNVFNDAGYIASRAANFMLNPSADRYDYVNSGSTINEVIENSPFPAGIPNVASDNIHSAAIYAAATDNQAMADAVLNQIYLRALDDNLDFGNGQGANNPNATYGVNNRYPIISFPGHPFALMPIKITKYLNSYTLLKSKGFSNLTGAQEDRLNGWFRDAMIYFKALNNASMSFHYGNDWINGNFSFVSQNVVSDTFTNPPFGDANGNANTNYTLSRLQRNTMSNTKLEFIHYVGLYGLIYNDTEAMDFADLCYKTIMKGAIFPDGTHFEIDRSSSSDVNLGVTGYLWINVGSLASIAMAPMVAKLNGLPSMANIEGNHLLEYTTSEGMEDLASGYVGSPTGGGPKNLRKLYEGTLKFVQQNYGSTYGWVPNRYARYSPYVRLGYDDNKRLLSHVCQFANLYFNDPILRSFARQDGGYDSWTTKKAYGTGAAGIGAGSSNSGPWESYIAFDDIMGAMDGIYLDGNTNPPITSNNNSIFGFIN